MTLAYDECTYLLKHFRLIFKMAEGSVAAYLMLDINCGPKNLYSGFIKVDKYSLTVGDLLSEKIPEGYMINEVFIAEGEGKKGRRVPTGMVFGNMFYMNPSYKNFTVYVTKIEEAAEPSTSNQETEPSALEILQKAAKSYTQLPDKR